MEEEKGDSHAILPSGRSAAAKKGQFKEREREERERERNKMEISPLSPYFFR
jgi:hypothetical protein